MLLVILKPYIIKNVRVCNCKQCIK
jgi:hypothetical protein